MREAIPIGLVSRAPLFSLIHYEPTVDRKIHLGFAFVTLYFICVI